MNNISTNNNSISILYDHDCPVCRFYVSFARIQQHGHDVVLVHARNAHDPRVQEAKRRGLDLNKGFVVIVGEQFYHGADALHALALLSNNSSLLSNMHYWIFRSHTRSRFIYPILTQGRNILLKLLGKKKI